MESTLSKKRQPTCESILKKKVPMMIKSLFL